MTINICICCEYYKIVYTCEYNYLNFIFIVVLFEIKMLKIYIV